MVDTLNYLQLFINLLQTSSEIWVYILIALLVAIEGPIMTLAGSVAAAVGILDPVIVFVSASLGNLMADTLWYAVGYAGKSEWLVKYGGWFGIKENFITRLQKDIHAHIRKILFIAKLTLGFAIPTLVAAGLARVPFKHWFGVVFAAECIWTGGLVVVGYYFGHALQSIESDLHWISMGGALIFAAILAFYLSRRKSNLESES